MNEITWLSHGGPGSGRYPKGSGEKNRIKKKYYDMLSKNQVEANKLGVFNKKDARYASKVEYKYGKSLKPYSINARNSRKNLKSSSKTSKTLKGLDQYDKDIRKARKSGVIDKDTFVARASYAYLDTKSLKYKIQEKKGYHTINNKNDLTVLSLKDVNKILKKATNSNKKYDDIVEDYVHNKRKKRIVAQTLSSIGSIGVGVAAAYYANNRS